MTPHQMERQWIAVRGDRIVGKGNTEGQASRAATEMGEEYWEIVAVPKGGAPSGPF